MTSRLQSLARHSTIVADTGEVHLIKKFRPQDCTTNPSLILKAAKMVNYHDLVVKAIRRGCGTGDRAERQVEAVLDELAVGFGCELLDLVPGYVSTEVDAALSFSTSATVAKAKHLISLYEKRGIDPKRILIKIASTWEGIQAARLLQQEGINCNMTLIFSLAQAVACAEAGAYLISPFVGRITDWHKAQTGEDFPPDKDPGVLSVWEIVRYFRHHKYNTIVMAASFRTLGQVEALAGCGRLTISPQLLDELASREGDVARQLEPDVLHTSRPAGVDVSEEAFRWAHNENPMATEKLGEGIRRFHSDTRALHAYIHQLL